MHKSQVFFYLLSAFIGGVFFASLFNIPTSLVYVFLIAGIACIALAGFKNKILLLVAFILIVFAGGTAKFNYFNSNGGNLIDMAGQEVVLNGYIDSEPDNNGNRSRFVFKTGDERVLITTSSFPRREFGDQLSVRGKLELPQNFTPSTSSPRPSSGQAGQAEFDYVTYLRKDGIRTTIFYPKEIETTVIDLGLVEKTKIAVYRSIFSLKNKFQNTINLSIPEPNAAFINGILLGTRQNIPDDLRKAFNKTGTTHILAISGYNIMIISEAILIGLIWFFKRRVAFWVSVGVIILFVILTGASASVVRAAIMGLLLSFARGYGRLYDQKNSIILTGGIMIWANPFVLVFDIGFQLSFVAVLGLVYLFPYIDSKLYKVPKLGNLKELALMTLSAQLAVLPLALYYFGNFSLASLPANVLILSFLPAAMLTGFLSGLAGMFFLPLGQFIGYVAWAITTYQIEIVKYFALLSL